MIRFVVDHLAPAPATGMLWVTTILLLATWSAVRYAERTTAPRRPGPNGRPSGGMRRESPAVVNLLTNDAVVTAAGFRATVIDLGARGWVRLLPPTADDELGRVRPAAQATDTDSLLPHERLVLQHILARFTTDHAIPAQYLAVDIRGGWWRRFSRLVVADARGAGLIHPRWSLTALLPAAVGTVLAMLAWLRAAGDGVEIAVVDSVERRAIGIALLVGIVALGVRVARHAVGRAMVHTDDGIAATGQWLAVRQRLVEKGFGPMAPSAIEIGDRRLAYATAMCLAEGAAVELPLAREDHRRAWSAVGGRARLVRVRYPFRLGYGLNPLTALVAGTAVCFVGLWTRRWFSGVVRGENFPWIYERVPERAWLVEDVATALTVLSLLPVLGGLWVAIAGAADMFATTERIGVVLRARRPAEVSPLPRPLRRLLERDRYSLFVAVDDGSGGTVVAWRATERNAIPQGATAIVHATPILGYVRKAVPVGHRLPG